MPTLSNRPVLHGEMTPSEYRQKRLADKRADYQRHKAKRAARMKQHYSENRAEIRAKQRSYYQKNKEKICASVARYQEANKDEIKKKDKARYKPAAFRNYFLQLKYGITEKQYQELLRAQNGKCANRACPNDGSEDSRRRPLFVDHCHTTNKVRGLLCNRCNRTLGMLKDSGSLIRGLAEYIEAAQ